MERYTTRNRHFFSKKIFSFLLALFSGALIYVAVFSSYLEISDIKVSGNDTISQDKILQEVNSQLSGKYAGLIAKKNLIFCPQERIKSALGADYKAIRTVEIGKKFPASLLIKIAERRVSMGLKSGDNSFLLDENGQAYDYYDSQQEPDLIVLYDQSGHSLKLYDFPLDTGYIKYVLGIRNSLRDNLNIEVDNFFQTPAIISNDLRVKTAMGWEIYFNLNIPLEKEIEMLAAALSEKILPSQKKNLEYIDLRINNKIFYKVKEVGQEKATPTESGKEEEKNKLTSDQSFLYQTDQYGI